MIGQTLNRVDGPLKVAGKATYAYEHWEAGQPLYGFILGATIGKGRITQVPDQCGDIGFPQRPRIQLPTDCQRHQQHRVTERILSRSATQATIAMTTVTRGTGTGWWKKARMRPTKAPSRNAPPRVRPAPTASAAEP